MVLKCIPTEITRKGWFRVGVQLGPDANHDHSFITIFSTIYDAQARQQTHKKAPVVTNEQRRPGTSQRVSVELAREFALLVIQCSSDTRCSSFGA